MTLTDIVQTGDPLEHRGITIVPLFPRSDPAAAYVTLDEALAGGLRVREVSEAGSVPDLAVENPLDARVLLYDGEELVGAKQNRILSVSVLVEAKSRLTIPVSCVEQGRWSSRSPHFLAGPSVAHAELRRRKAETQASQPLARGVAQAEVWDAVHDKALRMAVHSPTGASADIYRAYERDLRTLENAFAAQPGQSGAVLAVGDALCLDLVSRPDAFVRLWPKLRAGYLLDALERLDGKPASADEVAAFLRAVDGSSSTRRPSPGLGVDVRLDGERVVGSGLELDGELIQLSAFRSSEPRRAFGRIARPSRRRT